MKGTKCHLILFVYHLRHILKTVTMYNGLDTSTHTKEEKLEKKQFYFCFAYMKKLQRTVQSSPGCEE